MIASKHGYVGDKKCIKYSGTHEELQAMLRKGDIVTLLWQNDDKSKSVKISGTVTHHYPDTVFVHTFGEEDEYTLANANVVARLKYTITNIRRPVENMLPDSPGPWLDKNEDTWIVDDDFNAIRVSFKGTWLIEGVGLAPFEYAEYAPFKKINTTFEEPPCETK